MKCPGRIPRNAPRGRLSWQPALEPQGIDHP